MANMSNQFTVDLCLFDLDGTIVSTTRAVEMTWKKLCAEHDVDPEELFRFSHGTRTGEVFAKFFPDIDNTGNRAAVAFELSIADDLSLISLIPGAQELLLKLDKNTTDGSAVGERKWAIVTSGSPELTLSWFDNVLKEVGRPPVFISGADVAKGKPDPEGYYTGRNLLCQKLGLDASHARTVVFEDAPVGIMAGKAIGAITVGIAGTYDKDLLYSAGADYVVSDLNQVKVIENTKGGPIKLEIVEPLGKI